jgi:SsrA-binding protein
MPTYLTNKKVHFDFEVLDTYEAGLVLAGYEVKSIRTGKGSLTGGYVIVRGGEAYLVGVNINPYQVANTPKSYDPERARKLLLNKKQLAEIELATEKQGLTCVPIKLYSSNRKIKLEIAIVRGKKKHDKRESIKERDTKRDIDRTLKTQY